MKIINCQTLGHMCEVMLDGEPVFLIRGQDKLAPEVIAYYLELAKKEEARNTGRVTDVLKAVNVWQDKFPKKVKLPD